MRCLRRLTLHHYAQYAVDARLVALAMTLEPIEHVFIQTNGQLFFRGRPGHGGLFEKGLVEPRNVGIVNIGILQTVNRGWRDANRTAAGTAALQRRFPQRLKLTLEMRPIATANRCATQAQRQNRLFLQASRRLLLQKSHTRSLLTLERRGIRGSRRRTPVG